MVNILLETYEIDVPWLYNDIKKYIKPDSKIAVVAFSFRDSRVKSKEDWRMLYSKENGKLYNGIVSGFMSYGVHGENISFLNISQIQRNRRQIR